MATKKTDAVEEAVVVQKKPHGLTGKPSNGRNSPMIGMNGYNLEPGDNARNIQLCTAVMNLPDIDLKDPEQVQNRIDEYFALCANADMKPAVSGLALALNGMSRQTLWAIANDRPTGSYGYKTALPTLVADCIKKAYKIMEFTWENNFQSGKLNPVAAIFLGKNNYNYRDQQEHILTPNQKQDADYNAEDIRSRYLIEGGKDDE